VLVRDTDGVEGRVESIQRARVTPRKFSVVLGTPHTKMECWILAGFEPRGSDEEATLKELRSELGFDPCLRAEDLTAEARKGKRNAKNVLDRLTGKDPERAEACWRESDLSVLRQRGQGSKLTAYFEEISERWIPVVTGRHQP
jgi:hypothetical protein